MEEKQGTELNFLTYRLSINSHTTDVLLRNEVFYRYFKEIKDQGKHIDDKVVYDGLKELLFPMLHEKASFLHSTDCTKACVQKYGEDKYAQMQKGCRLFKQALNALSKSLYGDVTRWRYDYELLYGEPYRAPQPGSSFVEIPEENQDLAYLLDICADLSTTSLQTMVSDELIVKQIRKSSQITDIEEAYLVCREAFFKCIRRGYRNGTDEDKKLEFFRIRSLIRNFCEVLYGDRDRWHEELDELIKDANNLNDISRLM